MTLVILGLKTCDTCRKAVKALPDAHFRDIRAEPLTSEERATLLARFGDALINRASATWRGLSDDEKSQDIGELLARIPHAHEAPCHPQG